MAAYYNEIDPFAAAWLRELISAGLIAPGIVDERSIQDVRPDELAGYTQCHFFAGIGVWSYALRQAGWPDSKPVWTGSCPCQPFSAAGKGDGFDDERHLWPDFQWLIQQCQPAVVLGEQVASKAAEPWVDLVQSDLEAMGYAFGALPFPSAGVGAPHIRDRLFWVGHTDQPGSQGHAGHGGAERREGQGGSAAEAGVSGGLADADFAGLQRAVGQREARAERPPSGHIAERDSATVWLADTEHDGRGGSQGHPAEPSGDRPNVGVLDRGHSASQEQPPTGPTNGFWGSADWLFCRDGKWRPVEPGTFPLVDGAPARVGRLRGYGNAINAESAKVFIEAVAGWL